MSLVTRTVTNYLDPVATPGGAVKANATITFTLVDTQRRQVASLFDAVSGEYVICQDVTATTDSAGQFSVNLWPNSRGEFATLYKVAVSGILSHPFYISVADGSGDLSLVAARTAAGALTPQTTSLFDALLSSINAALGTVTSVVTTSTNGLMSYLDKVKLDAVSGTNTGDETAATIKSKLGVTTLSGSNTGDQDLSGLVTKAGSLTQITTRNHSDLSGIGTNSHSAIDTALTRLASTSGTNTGDETAASIKAALGVTTLSGSNTGDETATTIKSKLGITTLSGSNTGDQDLSGYAPLASPTFTGTPAAPTAAADTATTQVATTGFVLAQAASATPTATAVGGNGVVGTSTRYARADHAHPKGDASTLGGFAASQTGGASKVLVTDASGNLGFGVTPSAWGSGFAFFEVPGGVAYGGHSSYGSYICSNDYYDGTNWKYKANGAACHIVMSGNTMTFNSAALGTAGATISSFTYPLVVDANGYLLSGYTTSNGAYRLQVNGQIFATSSSIATSDARYKSIRRELTDGYDLVKAVAPFVFDWIDHPVHNFDTSTPTVGFLAQDWQQVLAGKDYLRAVVKENSVELPEGGTEEFLGIAEGNIIAILFSATKRLIAENEALAARVAALEAR